LLKAGTLPFYPVKPNEEIGPHKRNSTITKIYCDTRLSEEVSSCDYPYSRVNLGF
jgi:hypothetical protein